MTAALLGALLLLGVYRHETRPNRPVDVLAGCWTSARGLIVATRLLIGRRS